MTTSYFLTAVAISAVITFGLRALPFLAFSGSRKMPASLERLGQALPSAIMAVLIVYCIERYPIRRYLCRSTKITRRNSRLHHLQMETPDTDLHPARNDFLYDASASLLTILLFAKKERSHKLLSKFVTAFFFSCYAPINTFFPANANP